tara:strand:- start:3988 stop:4650 length:663 start_codon:yes stop_codon:yes gene_type:complete
LADEYVVSVVLEGNSTSLESASNRGAGSQDKLKKSTQEANIEFLAQVARYQAMTAALNQTIGGLNKLAGGMEAIGLEKTAEATRKLTKGLELIAGPAEIYLAYQTLSIALAQKDVAAKGKQTAATGVLAGATAALNAVMALNPMILIAMAVIVLIGVLILLEKKFGFVTKSVDMLNNALNRMDELVTKLVNGVRGLGSVFDKLNPLNAGKNLGKLVQGGL